ncbi:RimK family alpha-L-glutamate ligase [Methanocaldococcus infernus]|uniref:Alpha-L-glutamate ligase, RimK family n=1 Tax=Methanocaldococcus infernus (strain DSM 11812 / JCM 15783 / ME) TaxID=573063 RepID=D5VR43_METIM|nr:RimK family alpha-L-glutamate ligase [Methanocaldococcus infernus]ADG13046.1 alpha-L-glutamate ligase, RimK family [Methanocaldococcus infernus ME]
MKLGIVSLEKDDVVLSLMKACEEKGVDYRLIDPRHITIDIHERIVKYYKTNLLNMDCFFIRNIGWEWHRSDVLKYLANFVPTINKPEVIDICGNKLLTTIYLDKFNFPQPKTLITENENDALLFIEEVGDVVVKPIFGHGGEGIHKIKEDMPIASKVSLLRNLKKVNKVLYIQEYINSDRDIRAFFIDNKIYCMYRYGKSWKHNVSQGAEVEPCKAYEKMKKLVLDIKEKFGLFYGGVDLIEKGNKLLVLEVNATPSWIAISKAHEVNLASILLDNIIKQI